MGGGFYFGLGAILRPPSYNKNPPPLNTKKTALFGKNGHRIGCLYRL
jgi:hypothetical protein